MRCKNEDMICVKNLSISYQCAIGRASLAQLFKNKVRLKVLPEQLTLFVNTSVTFKKCIIQ